MSIELKSNEVEVIIAFHKRNITRLQDVIRDAEDEISESMYRIKQLCMDYNLHDPFLHQETISQNQYEKSDPLWKKIRTILELERIPLTTSAISTKMREKEAIGNEVDLISKISSTLKQKIEKKETFRRVENGGEYYYGLIDWPIEDLLKKKSRTGFDA